MVLFLKQEKLNPIIDKDKEVKVDYYKPIMSKKKCLMCHGEIESQVDKSTYDLIKIIYQKDRVTGFEEEELRGIINITFKK